MSIEGQGHFFTIYFSGFVCLVLYWDKTSGERLQDHCSSGYIWHYPLFNALLSFLARLHEVQKSYCSHHGRTRSRNMRSITRHRGSYGHPLHPDLTPDVLTCVLPLGTVSSGRESEVESAHLFLTIIHFFSACLTSYFSTHKHLHTQLNHITYTYTLTNFCRDVRVSKQ